MSHDGIWSSSGEVNSCPYIQWGFFFGTEPSSERPSWPRSGPFEPSGTMDLICSSAWTHKGPQLDLRLPQQAITGEPDARRGYINIPKPHTHIPTIHSPRSDRWLAWNWESRLIASIDCRRSRICKQWVLVYPAFKLLTHDSCFPWLYNDRCSRIRIHMCRCRLEIDIVYACNSI